MPDTGVGCTSWRGLLLRPASAAASKAAFAACAGPLAMVESNEGGLMAPSFWVAVVVVRPRSGWEAVSCTVEGARLLDFLDSWSRGSSWQRCPMLRLMHLVQGLSCLRNAAPRVNVCPHTGPIVLDMEMRWGRGTYEIARHVLSSRTWLATRTTGMVRLAAALGGDDVCVCCCRMRFRGWQPGRATRDGEGQSVGRG
jgi:hypothetical protein